MTGSSSFGAHDQALEVQDDVGDILLHTGTVGELVQDASMRMLVTAAPGIDDSRVRRSELPRVYPKPGSRGSMTNFERFFSDDLFGQRGFAEK